MARGRYIRKAQQRVNRAQARLRGRGRIGGGRGRGGDLGAPAPMPWDSQAQRESAELGNEAADTRAAVEAKYNRAQSELGFGAGAVNPYSASAENKSNLSGNQRGITNTAGTQLYAGSTINAQSAARSQYDKAQKALEDRYAEDQADYNKGNAQTTREEQLGISAIKEGAIARAAASDPEPIAVTSSGPRRGGGRGRIQEGHNIRRPGKARVLNARARTLNARINSGRGRM